MKNTDTAKQKGYAAGKKVSGIKRHIGGDTLGLPPALTLITDDVTDLRRSRGVVFQTLEPR